MTVTRRDIYGRILPEPAVKIPANARGMSASPGYWGLHESHRDRYARGWWDCYDKKPARSHEFAYLLGYSVSRLAHSHAAVLEVRT